MQPAVFAGVTNKLERNGGAYSNTKRFTIRSAKIKAKYTVESRAMRTRAGGTLKLLRDHMITRYATRMKNTPARETRR